MVALIALLPIVGCNVVQNHESAEDEVTKFHQKLDRGESTTIYRAGHADLHRLAEEKEFVGVLDAVHRKLGNTLTSIEHGWQVNSINSQTNVVMMYKTTFEHGEGMEEFVYRIGDAEPKLVSYGINSADLIMK